MSKAPGKIIEKLSDDQLRTAFREGEVLRLTGIMEDGLVRQLAGEFRETLPLPYATCQSMVMDLCLREIARRWAGDH